MAWNVTVENSYGTCGHDENGCSGPETIHIVAIHPQRGRFEAQKGSCFGVDIADLISNLLNQVAV